MKLWLLLFDLAIHWEKSELILIIYDYHLFDSFYILFQTSNYNMFFIFLIYRYNTHFVGKKLYFIFVIRLGLVIVEINKIV